MNEYALAKRFANRAVSSIARNITRHIMRDQALLKVAKQIEDDEAALHKRKREFSDTVLPQIKY